MSKTQTVRPLATGPVLLPVAKKDWQVALAGSDIHRERPPRAAITICLLSGAVLIAAGIRVFHALETHICLADESCFLWLAQNLFNGTGYTFYNGRPELHYSPLFPVALGLLNLAVQDIEVVSRVAAVLFGSLLPLPIYHLGRRMYGRGVGLLAAYLIAVHPALTSGYLLELTLAEPLFLFCLFTAVYFTYAAVKDGRWQPCALAGASFSLAYLARPEGFLYLPAAMLCVAFAGLRARPRNLKSLLVRLALLPATFLLLASPYIHFLHAHTGRWMLTTKSTTSYTTTRSLVHGNKADFLRETNGLDASGEMRLHAPDLEGSLPSLLLGPYRHRVFSDIKANFKTARSYLQRPWVLGRIFFVLAFLGLLHWPWKQNRFANEAFNLVMLAPLAMVFVFFIQERFLYPLLLPFTLWAACGVRHVIRWAESTHLPGPLDSFALRRGAQAGFLVIVSFWLVIPSYRRFVVQNNERNPRFTTIAWMKKNLPENAVVMTNGTELDFHAKRGWLPIPMASKDEILAYGRQRGATHICLYAPTLAAMPEVRHEFLEQDASGPDLDNLTRGDAGVEPLNFVAYRIRAPGESR